MSSLKPHEVKPERARREGASPATSALASVAFIAAVAVWAVASGQYAPAVYVLSFWHYLIYALAVGFAAVPIAVLKRDAVLMKSVALVALFAVYLPAVSSPLSLAVVAAGFLLNAAGALALGSDRTYYGHEIAAMPLLRVTVFPYSVLSHPMLVGNMVAFAGLLLDPAFRRDWWPLATAHVLLNLLLLAVEKAIASSDRRHRLARQLARVLCHASVVGGGVLVVVGAAAGAALVASIVGASPLVPAAVGGCVAGYALALLHVYGAKGAAED